MKSQLQSQLIFRRLVFFLPSLPFQWRTARWLYSNVIFHIEINSDVERVSAFVKSATPTGMYQNSRESLSKTFFESYSPAYAFAINQQQTVENTFVDTREKTSHCEAHKTYQPLVASRSSGEDGERLGDCSVYGRPNSYILIPKSACNFSSSKTQLQCSS